MFASYDSEDDFEDWEVTKLMLFVPSGTTRYPVTPERGKLNQGKGKLTNEIVKMINDGLFVYEQVRGKQTSKQIGFMFVCRIAHGLMILEW